MREPEGGFSSSGLARMFEGMAGKEAVKNDGPTARPETNFRVAILTLVLLETMFLL